MCNKKMCNKLSWILLVTTLLVVAGTVFVTGSVPSQAQNVSRHALIVCKPSAGLYDNSNPNGRKIDVLPFGRKVGFRGYVGDFARVEVYGAPSEVHWGFVHRQCVGSFDSW